MRADVQGREHPRGVALVPFQGTFCEEASEAIQHEIRAERQLYIYDVEAEGRSTVTPAPPLLAALT